MGVLVTDSGAEVSGGSLNSVEPGFYPGGLEQSVDTCLREGCRSGPFIFIFHLQKTKKERIRSNVWVQFCKMLSVSGRCSVQDQALHFEDNFVLVKEALLIVLENSVLCLSQIARSCASSLMGRVICREVGEMFC